MKLRSIEQMPEIRGKRVLVRVDHNVEFDQNGVLKDDHKIRLTLRTLEYLVDRGAKLTLMTHVGRPKGNVVENLRFDPREEGNDSAFAKELATHGEYFVNEAFPSLHAYEETSTCGVPRLLPSYAGFY